MSTDDGLDVSVSRANAEALLVIPAERIAVALAMQQGQTLANDEVRRPAGIFRDVLRRQIQASYYPEAGRPRGRGPA